MGCYLGQYIVKDGGSIQISDTIFQCLPLQEQCISQNVFGCNFSCLLHHRYIIKYYLGGSSLCTCINEIFWQRYKLARDKNDLDVLQLLILKVSVFLQATNGNIPHYLYVALDKTRPKSITKKNVLTKLMSAQNLSKSLLTSRFIVEAVSEFQVRYQNARASIIF